MVIEKGLTPDRTSITLERSLFDNSTRRVERKPDPPFSGRIVVDLESTDLLHQANEPPAASGPATVPGMPAPSSASVPDTVPFTPVPLKTEPGVFPSLSAAPAGAPIDLDTPSTRPTQAKRRRLHGDNSESEDDDGLPGVGEAPEDE